MSPFSWLIAALPSALAVRFAADTPALLAAGAFSFLVYLAMYWYVASASKQAAPAGRDADEAAAPVR